MVCFLLFFFFFCFGDHRDLHSFPTRRSSDLLPSTLPSAPAELRAARSLADDRTHRALSHAVRSRLDPRTLRSEEHTSELQSRRDLVCRLLLEKKKTTSTRITLPPRRHPHRDT